MIPPIAHDQVEHQGNGQIWLHHISEDIHIIGGALFGWLLFFLILNWRMKNRQQKVQFGSLFGIANIIIAITLDRQHLFSALIFLNSGFLLLIYSLFKDRLKLKEILNGRKSNG